MRFVKLQVPISEETNEEIKKAEINATKESLETQKLITQYLALMTGVYLPEEEVNSDVSSFV